MDAQEHYRAGRLKEAVLAATEAVKKSPADSNRRGLLAELLLLAGNLDRADAQLDALTTADAQSAPHVAALRQLVRAEQARHQVFAEGRVPEFVGLPTDAMKERLRATVLLRAGQVDEAAKCLATAEAARKPVHGTCDGTAFDDLRDLDDVTADFFEVLSTTGKYFWIPFDRVISVEFRAPARPRDTLWRRAAMSVRDGPEGEVFLPAVYVDLDGKADDAARLARTTDWLGGDGKPVRGVGQRTLLVGETARPILEIRDLRFEA